VNLGNSVLSSRLLQCPKTSKISWFVSGRGNTSPFPGLGTPQARLIHDLKKQSGSLSRRKHGQEGGHDIVKRLALGEPRGNKRCHGPQRLRLGVTTPRSCRTIQLRLDMSLELVKQACIVLGCPQHAVSDGDQGNMPGYCLEVPHVILIEPIRFACFVIDFTGPAMASDAGDPPGLPLELVREARGSCIRESSLAVIDDHPLLAKVMDAMGFAVTVVGLLVSLVGDGQFAKHRWAAIFAGLMGFLLQMSIECISSLVPLLQPHKIIPGQGTHIRDLEGFVEKPAQGGLSIPVVKGDRYRVVWVSTEELAQYGLG
jgi:hypothetical protein